MKGYLYKDFMLAKFSLLTTVILQVIASFVAVLFSCLKTAVGEYGFVDAVIVGCCYVLVFVIASFAKRDMFEKDERILWKNFTLSTVNGVEKQVKSKYTVILVIMIFIVSSCYLTDAICVAICKEQAISLSVTIFVVFCFKLLTTAIELPFIIRYGVAKGSKVKGIILLCIAGVFILYALFGDISMFLRQDFFHAMSEFMQQAGTVWVLAILPYVAFFGYLLSYKISLKCFRKERDLDD